MDDRIREAHRYSRQLDYSGGFNTFEEGRVGNDRQLEYQVVSFSPNDASIRDFKQSDLPGNPSFNDIAAMGRAAHRVARGSGYATGIPTFEQSGENRGVALLKPSVVQHRSIPASSLSASSFSDPKGMFIAVHRYARTQGFISGFPVFEEGIENGVRHVGVALVRDTGAFRQVLADSIQSVMRSTFDQQITGANRRRMLDRFDFAMHRLADCNALSTGDRAAVRATYLRGIDFGINNDPNANASATLNGRQIDVNFGVLFPKSDDEVSQTLLHELTHCANFNHPAYRPGIDTPGDEGQYYGTTPLQAEICIAGQQSLVEKGGTDCRKHGNVYTIVPLPTP